MHTLVPHRKRQVTSVESLISDIRKRYHWIEANDADAIRTLSTVSRNSGWFPREGESARASVFSLYVIMCVCVCLLPIYVCFSLCREMHWYVCVCVCATTPMRFAH